MKPTERKVFRCAIYTRKSTKHNLDLEFNSLDAQREACEAYIKSQAHEGWRLIRLSWPIPTETTRFERRTAAAASSISGWPGLLLRLSGGGCTRRRRHRHRHVAVTEIDKSSEHEGKHDCAH